MKAGRTELVPLGVGVSLISLSALTLVVWASSPGLYPADWVELLAFVGVAVRVAAVLASRRLRGMSPSMLVVTFGADVLVYLSVLAVSSAVGEYSLAVLASRYVAAWIGASILLDPIPASYYAVIGFRRHIKLSSLVPGTAGYLTLLSLTPGVLSSTAGNGGLAGVGLTLAEGLRGAAGPAVASPVLVLSAALLFVCLLAYSMFYGLSGSSSPTRPLLLAVLGAAGAVIWGAVSASMPFSFVALALPSLAICVAVWWFFRGP